MKRSYILLILLMLNTAICSAQTIRNSDNSVIAKIDRDGTIRYGNNSVIIRIKNNGDIRDSNNHLLVKIGSNGDVRNNNNSYLVKVESYGTVRDSNNHTIVHAIGVSMKYTAVFSFLLSLTYILCTIFLKCANHVLFFWSNLKFSKIMITFAVNIY